MRSLLIVPATDAAVVHAAFDAAFAAGPDAVVLDLGHGHGDPALREGAGRCVRDLLRAAQTDERRAQIYVRLEGLDEDTFAQDLATVMEGEPDGIVLGACRSAADLQHLGARLAVHEAEHDLAEGSTVVLAEAASSAAALFALGGYRGASERLVSLSWHAERLAADLVGHTAGERPMAYPPFETARHLTLFAARAAEVAALDSASLERDPDAFLAECRLARSLGFNGKFATTPGEVAIIHATFGFDAG